MGLMIERTPLCIRPVLSSVVRWATGPQLCDKSSLCCPSLRSPSPAGEQLNDKFGSIRGGKQPLSLLRLVLLRFPALISISWVPLRNGFELLPRVLLNSRRTWIVSVQRNLSNDVRFLHNEDRPRFSAKSHAWRWDPRMAHYNVTCQFRLHATFHAYI